jgi:diguanylate cyclase (GGDEF)-like protein
MFALPSASPAFVPHLCRFGVRFGQQQPLPPESDEEIALTRMFQEVGTLAQESTQQQSLLQQMDRIRQQTLAFIRKLKISLETDSLTGLKNRRFFERVLAAEFEDSRRQGKPLSVIMVDLDRFKHINDQFGHDAGDAALKHFAVALREGVGQQGFACRLGGDEFAVLLPDTRLPAAQAVANRIRNAVSQANFQFNHNGVARTIQLASSQGIGTLDGTVPPTGVGGSAIQALMSLGLGAPSQRLVRPKLTGLQRFNPFRRWKLHKLWKKCVQQPGCAKTPGQLINIADHAMYCAKNLAKLLATRHPILGQQVGSST